MPIPSKILGILMLLLAGCPYFYQHPIPRFLLLYNNTEDQIYIKTKPGGQEKSYILPENDFVQIFVMDFGQQMFIRFAPDEEGFKKHHIPPFAVKNYTNRKTINNDYLIDIIQMQVEKEKKIYLVSPDKKLPVKSFMPQPEGFPWNLKVK